jgi:hypothetical protein
MGLHNYLPTSAMWHMRNEGAGGGKWGVYVYGGRREGEVVEEEGMG